MCRKCAWSRPKNPIPDLTGCGTSLGKEVPHGVRAAEYIHRRLFHDFEQWACGNCYKKGDIRDLPSASHGQGPALSAADDFDWMKLWTPVWECKNCRHRVCSQPHHCVMRNTKCESIDDVLFWVNDGTGPEWDVRWWWYKEGDKWKIQHEQDSAGQKRGRIRDWLQKT